ncbi:MAG: hypothetical protein JJU37_11925 [Balneolaceae bacterium]|nr:hypothetical protein [Balneolaceae bacterium]
MVEMIKSAQVEEKTIDIRTRHSFGSEINRSQPEKELQCLVFRTSLQNFKDVEKISITLNDLAGISDWHVDLDDWERILRIECTDITSTAIIRVLLKNGVIAEELPV